MKKIYTYMMMVLMALPMLTLTSCDRDAQDRYEARTLEGTWTGYIDTYYFDRWGKRGETFRTSISFGREIETTFIRITILEVMPGWKYADTCISEIQPY
jgi:hypothetical protein